jgi:hypothetical protein
MNSMSSMIGRLMQMQQSAEPPAQEFPGGAQPPPGSPGSAGQLPGQLGGNMQGGEKALGAAASHLSGAPPPPVQLQQQQQASEDWARVEEHVNSGPGGVRKVQGGGEGRGEIENGQETGRGRARSPSPDLTCLSDVSNGVVKQESGLKRRKGNDGMASAAAAAPLLEQLRYGQVIKKIAEIRKLTKAGMKKIGEELVLPRIIVIGNESSGKSSTLERIAGQPVLPCDTGICTRAPVVLELKYDPTVIDAKIYFRGFTGEYEQVHDAEQARGKVKDAMDSLKDVGVASDKEVRVKIVSQDVPTLDLVDLPGIVLARNNTQGSAKEPDSITQQTVDCTTRFLSSEETGVVLCVVNANEPNLRTVKALGLLQEGSQCEKLKNSTIGVFAQTDKLFDNTYKEEGRAGPRWKLEERLRGTADDQVHLVHGFVAVKNRNSRSKAQEDLSACWSTENTWFAKESAFRQNEEENKAVVAELSERLGIRALINQIDTVFCMHLNQHWVPKELEAVNKERNEIKAKYDGVSTCLRRLKDEPDRTNFVEHIRSRIANVLSDSQLELWCQEYVVGQLRKANGQWDKNSLVACLRGVHKATADLAELVKDAHAHFSLKFETTLESEFNKESPWSGVYVGDPAKFIDLRPYKPLRDGVLKALRVFLVEQSAKVAYQASLEMLPRFLVEHRADYFTNEITSHPSLEAHVCLILLQHLLLPCVQGIGDKEATMPWLPFPAEFDACASAFEEEMKKLKDEMQTCDQVKSSLKDLC